VEITAEHTTRQLSAAATVHLTATLRVIEAALGRHSTTAAAAAAAAAAAVESTDHSSFATSSSSSSSTALQDSIAAAHAMAVAMSAQLREGSNDAVQTFHTSNGCGMLAVARHTSTLPRGAVLATLQQLQNSGHPLAALDLAVATAAADRMQRDGEHSSTSVVATSSSSNRREVVQWLAEGLRGCSTTAGTSTSLQQASIATDTSSSANSSSSSSSSGSFSSSSVCDSAVKLRLHLLQLVVHGAPGLAEAAIKAAVAVGDAPYVQALQLAAESAAEDRLKARNVTPGKLLQYLLQVASRILLGLYTVQGSAVSPRVVWLTASS
jgi:hypothetical protein